MMSENVLKDMKLIRAPSVLVTKINNVANQQGKTLYNYISEIFEQAIRAHDMKKSLKEILNEYEILEVQKEAGTIFTPSDILDFIIKETYIKNNDGELVRTTLKQIWYQTGKWYGIYIKSKFSESLKTFVRLLREGRWGLNEVTIKEKGDKTIIKCVSPLLSQDRTFFIQNFINGAMDSLGYKVEGEECFKGIIRLVISS
jgi:hypothetical protein